MYSSFAKEVVKKVEIEEVVEKEVVIDSSKNVEVIQSSKNVASDKIASDGRTKSAPANARAPTGSSKKKKASIDKQQGKNLATCCVDGPGYASPQDACMYGPREKFIFITCPRYNSTKGDMIASVDVDPTSKTFCQIVSRIDLPYAGDEAHHTGWNACSSCFGDSTRKRTHMVVPCLNSSRVYFINATDPKNLKLDKIIEPEELKKKDASFPHTTHCLADGNIMLSVLGDAEGYANGSFLLIDGKTFTVKGKWEKSGTIPLWIYLYDFWYQPRQNVMISSEWGHPNLIKKGLDVEDVKNGKYGDSLHVWDWNKHTLIQTIKLEGSTGSMPLEVRFLHDPESTDGFVCTALGSALYHFHKDPKSSKYLADKVVEQNPLSVVNWALPSMPALITDILISMDDRFLYAFCWLHGDIRQYDITEPAKPKLVGQVFIGGSVHTGTNIIVKNKEFIKPTPRVVKGKVVTGGPQMLQLSLDGKRLYVSTSLYSIWDAQFYPELVKRGGTMLQVDANTDTGGLKVNEQFLVDFGDVPGGPFLAHEMRYPGGDCTSDIWI